jgi:allophanate hydrolase
MSLSLSEYRQAYANGARPEDLIAAALARLERTSDPGIFLHLADEELLAAMIRAIGPFDPVTKPLWGVPFAVKDNIDVAGMPTTAACPAYAYMPAEDAAVVAKLKAAGAIPIGKTNLDQFATGLVGLRTPYPAPLNALDPKLAPGGSSSGSAVAVAQGLVPFALGTDTAGSGRVPAGLNGIVGLKPSLGALSARGVIPACRSLDCVSIFAANASDAWQVFQAASGFDPADAYSRTIAQAAPWAGPQGLTVGIPARAELVFDGCQEAEAAFDRAIDTLTAVGMTVKEVPFADFFAIAQLLYEGPWVAERYAAIRSFIEEQPNALHPVTRTIIEKAHQFSAADAFAAEYALVDLRRQVEPLLATVDLLCVPTAPRNATVEQVLADPVGVNSMLGTYTNFVNLLGLCGLTMPCVPRPDGEPASITLLAPAGHDLRLAALAERIGPGLALQASEQSIPLVVVGAHLSGMPLSHQLQDLGAAFVGATETAPLYRLFALPNSMPPKPGMLRVRENGAAIGVEVWRMSPTAFGRFVATIPAPLCIGDIRLADGCLVKGFLVEAEGARDAEDITCFGGWRAYMTAR